MGGHASPTWSPYSCFLFEFFLETSPQVFHTATTWLTMSLAFLRYIYICHPVLAKLYCTQSLAVKIVCTVVFLAVVQNTPKVLDREYLVISLGL